MQSVTELPDGIGADAASAGFIEGFRPKVQWMTDTFNLATRKKDYSGRWPVFTYGTKSQTPQPAEADGDRSGLSLSK